MVNALMYFKKMEGSSNKPDYMAGHSLGEYSALLAAEAFDFETGLRLVQKRGEIMSRATGGGMAAIIGLNEEKIKGVLEERGLTKIDIANYNSPFQIVVSGLKEDIKQAIFKYLDYMIPSLNDRDFLFSRYDNTHKLTGCLEAIAEIQKFYPELLDLPNPWIETLDITPWI